MPVFGVKIYKNDTIIQKTIHQKNAPFTSFARARKILLFCRICIKKGVICHKNENYGLT